MWTGDGQAVSGRRQLAAVEAEHPVDLQWRDHRAQALESEARVIAVCLLELANCEELFEARRDSRTCAEIRQLAGLLRSEAAEITDHARELRLADK